VIFLRVVDWEGSIEDRLCLEMLDVHAGVGDDGSKVSFVYE